MKKLVRIFVVALLVVAAAMVVVYRAVNRVPSAELPVNEQVLAIFDDGGCMSCHSADPKVPFYAKLPVAGKVIMKDIDSGYRAFDIEPLMKDLEIGAEVNLSKRSRVPMVCVLVMFRIVESELQMKMDLSRLESVSVGEA